ncbi:MAG: alanine racemase [Bacteroidales bacterium]|nr:alanine racemase [Bacteroidales bacterium]MDD2322763.1 alanine racemase [Bacteroidales bacterium]MDD3011098.1 alanine racemase [Bacteroidales bacterium]MDD3960262.1 alanine racemase [Bacteroidales bacterium]MDY0284788.1 alanine racemase [Bacteroidales bacterium]
MNTAQIIQPELILNTQICKENIRQMAGKALASGSLFRPHFKTHQSRGVASWFREVGVTAITVSSLRMAALFIASGWKDITVAMPFNLREVSFLEELLPKARIHILIDSVEAVRGLDRRLSMPVGAFLKMDCGYGRSGVGIDDGMAIDRILTAIHQSEHLQFRGFLTHSGHTYHATSREEIVKISLQVAQKMKRLKKRWFRLFPDAIISIGDTPGCSLMDDFSGIDEVRPGNFVFYDLMQKNLGSCDRSRIAVAVAAPVLGLYPERNTVIVHCGGVHLSKESIQNSQGVKLFGQVVWLTDSGWQWPAEEIFVTALSQEHGIIQANPGLLRAIQHGALLGIIPVHSCLTVSCFSEYLTTTGERLKIFRP